jgi:Tol biopolymer transport system component
MKKISIILIVLVFLFLSPLIGCATMDQKKNDIIIRNISFSPDGKKLLFNYQKGNQPYMIQTYNMETGELIAYKSQVGEIWDFPKYSFDGKQIVFVTVPLKIEHITGRFFSEKTIEVEDFIKSQIAVMGTDGRNVRKITNTPGSKKYPSFSHSGRKIICVVNREPNIRGSSTDIYEVDVKTGQETRLTQFSFISVSKPYYFPDDKTFIFEGFNFMDYPGIPGRPTTEYFLKVGKMREELHFKYGNNSIYVMQKNEKKLKPYIIMPDYPEKFGARPGDVYSKSPSLSANGSVLIFWARGYKPDGSGDDEVHLYKYSSDGNHRSIAGISPWTPDDAVAVSPNGKLIVVIPLFSNNNIIIYQVKDGTSREISLPNHPSRIINCQ